jgi:hypothetical protein
MESFRGLLRFGAFLSFLAVLLFYGDGRLLNIDGRALATSDCEDICNGGSDCSDPCWYYPPGMPGVEITCGEFDGGSLNGRCEGYCGDGYCNNYDNIENIYVCDDDCGYCGDTLCDFTESASSCSDDCDDPPAQGGPCDPDEPEDPGVRIGSVQSPGLLLHGNPRRGPTHRLRLRRLHAGRGVPTEFGWQRVVHYERTGVLGQSLASPCFFRNSDRGAWARRPRADLAAVAPTVVRSFLRNQRIGRALPRQRGRAHSAPQG